MQSERFSFQNRHGLKIVGDILHPENPKGLAFIQHGLTSARNRPHIQLLATIFSENDYTAVTFDCTNSFGESDGALRDVTQTSYIEDLEDVIAYIKGTDFYQEPFILAGHSMGGLSVLYLTLKNPDKVKAIAPLSSTISGKLRIEAYERFEPEEMQNWKESGFLEMTDRFNVGVKDSLPWSLMANWLQYDVLEQCTEITCPAFLAVGEDDLSTPLYQQQMLFDRLSGAKELLVVPHCKHNFRSPEELAALEKHFRKWLGSL